MNTKKMKKLEKTTHARTNAAFFKNNILLYQKYLYTDAEVDAIKTRTRWERHMLRCQLMQHHVLWARCANLYNETFNNQSMADIVWSYPL